MHSRQRWCDGGAVEPCSNLSLLQTIMMWWYDVTVIWRYEDMRSWRCRDRDTGGWGPRSGRPSATPPCCSSSWVGTWSTVILETYCEILLSPSILQYLRYSASKRSIQRFVITDYAPTRAFSSLKAATTAFTFKTQLRHYAKQALTPRSLNVKLGPRRNYHKGRAVWLG